MLRQRAGDSHDSQADMTPPGTSLTGLVTTDHRWPTLATFPQSLLIEVLSTISVRIWIRTGRIWLLSRTVYMTKLMNHDGSRRPPKVEVLRFENVRLGLKYSGSITAAWG